ncbi:MAG: tetratricopeptide repeat protein [Vicinamibacterales bacterium]
MRAESIILAIAGAFFGLIVGWVLGTQQARPAPAAAAAVSRAQPAPASQAPQPKPVDEARVETLRAAAERDSRNARVRVELGNMYFDAERYEDAITWYKQALAIEPKDADVSTDLGVSYYYLDRPDEALAQFDRSLEIDPGHAKTILNQGIVRAFGKQDLNGAVESWQRLIAMSPDSPEGQAAKRALDSLASAHPNLGGQPQKETVRPGAQKGK